LAHFGLLFGGGSIGMTAVSGSPGARCTSRKQMMLTPIATGVT